MKLLRIFGLILPLAMSVAAFAGEGQRVILVLDASGSMWGQIDGKPKMEIAKEVVGKVVGSWKPADELGLVAYGHRVKGSCEDIEVLIEPGPLDAGRFMAKVKALNPKGKTPMTQAVRQAAEALKFTERQATVILVSDGIETCDPDPCAVAEELERLGIGLTVHTVGFGLDDRGAVAQLQCLAERTGGISVLAENAGELEEALTRTVEAVPSPAPAPQPEPAPAFNLQGDVQMAEGVALPPPFSTPTWEFFRVVNGQRGDWLKTEYGRSIRTSIAEPGDYIARLSIGATAMEVPVTIEAGKVAELDVSLEAGIVGMKAMLDDKTPAPAGGLVWELFKADGTYVATEYGQDKSFLAPAGAYRLRLSLGEARVEKDIAIAAGRTDQIVMTLGAGVAEVSAVFAPGGPAVSRGATMELFKAEAALDGSRQHVATDYRAVSKFNVPAGRYVAVVTVDHARGEGLVDVPAGGTGKVEVNLDGGFLAIDGPDGAMIEVFAAEKDLAGNRRHIATEYRGDINLAFPAGRYAVVLSRDGEVLAEREFEVKAGQRTEAKIP